MGFFFTEAKTEAQSKPVKKARRADIPIQSLHAMGCSACPRDKDENRLNSPKMRPSGSKTPSVYLLGGTPSREEDEDDNHWTDKAGDAIYNAFGDAFMRDHVRSNFITQCHGERTAVEIECCRHRIVADIEDAKPLVVVGIGDDPLTWATGLPSYSASATTHRGTLFAVKIGKHTCWYYCLLYPNFVHKKSYGKKSEFELALNHDIKTVKSFIRDGMPPGRPGVPTVYAGPYDTGIEIITGSEPGDFNKLVKALQELALEPRSALDYETNCLRPFMRKDAKILTAAVGTFTRTVAFPVDHPEGWPTEYQRAAVRALLLAYLMDSGRKTAHNLAFEMEWSAYVWGPQVLRRTEWDDTMAQCHTLDERSGTKSLEVQTIINFGFNLKAQSNIDTKRILEYPLVDVLRYNGMDTKWSDLLRDVLTPLVEADAAYVREYERKVRLAPTLVLTEIVGVDFDPVYAREQERSLSKQLAVIETKLNGCQEVQMYNRHFPRFSATNPDHHLKLYRDICKRPEVKVIDKRTKAVRWTTSEDVLVLMPPEDVPSAPLILEHRGISKLKSTYVDPALAGKWVCPDGRIRSKYSSMVAVTGRLASEDTNVQNWPSRKHKEIRGMIYAPPGEWMVACDYGQIEFRVVGMASEDENLVRACWTGYDVHKFWAERLVDIYPKSKDWIVKEFSVDWDEKGIKTLRQEMKNKWVFPQLFGASLQSCAENLHLPEHVTEDLGAEFWDEFQGVKRWQEKVLRGYEKNLYVETLGGRKRRGPMTKNEIINLPIQGTAADIVLESMNVISEHADASGDAEFVPRINVHDDLTFVLADASLDTKIEVIAREMCLPRFRYINVPLVVEVKVGSRWHDLTEIKVYKSHDLFGTPNPYV